MIYVSSACVKNKYIKDSVLELANEGFQNIELSGGTQLYDNLELDLLTLKKEYNLNYLCHNYFPPPPMAFVVNLASLDDEIYSLSIEHLQRAIKLSESLGANRLGFHAGFLINIPLDQIGKPINSQKLFNRDQAMVKFIEGFQQLKDSTNIELYIENNVVSDANYRNFNDVDPFFMTRADDINAYRKVIDFGLILDVAHLKVSSRTLNISFDQQMEILLPLSDYLHISDNDGLSDSNRGFRRDSDMFNLLKKHNLKNKIYTIEVYESMEAVKESYKTLEQVND
ncbi:MAG: sugar phosphate isomerase/epimerase [Parvicellaceae bacterium]|jgi:sugar phosphate isomerase/epimerase